MMGHRVKMRGGDEYDAFSNWRKVIAANHSERAKTKRRFNKRERRHAKQVGYQVDSD